MRLTERQLERKYKQQKKLRKKVDLYKKLDNPKLKAKLREIEKYDRTIDGME